jgi:methionine synthase II (cobalamin-independent)
LLRFGGQILSIVGLFIPPIRFLSVIAGGIFSGLAGLFKSQEQKRREAVQNISVSLIEQLTQHKHTTLQQAVTNFNKYCSDVSTNINTYFEELIAGLDAILVQLEAAKSKLSGTANYLNCAYAKRIIDWCIEQHEPLTDEGINRTVAKVERDFGRSMNIQTKSKFQLRKSQDDIKRVLQEDVSIQSIKY